MDLQLPANARLSPALKAKVRDCAVMIIVHSKAYRRSPWTKGEMLGFLKKELKRRSGTDSQVFVVEISNVERLPALKEPELLGTQFWEMDPLSKRVKLLGFTSAERDDPSYVNKIMDLSQDIAAELTRQRAGRPRRQPGFAPLPGSHRLALRGSRRVGPAKADERIEVTVRLRPREEISSKARSDTTVPSPRRVAGISPTENSRQNTAPRPKIWPGSSGLPGPMASRSCEQARAAERLALGHGRQMSKTFGVELAEYQPSGRRHVSRPDRTDRDPERARRHRGRRVRPGQPPSSQAPLPDSPARRSKSRPPRRDRQLLSSRRSRSPSLYNFPPGGWNRRMHRDHRAGRRLHDSDLKTYFSSLGIIFSQRDQRFR